MISLVVNRANPLAQTFIVLMNFTPTLLLIVTSSSAHLFVELVIMNLS